MHARYDEDTYTASNSSHRVRERLVNADNQIKKFGKNRPESSFATFLKIILYAKWALIVCTVHKLLKEVSKQKKTTKTYLIVSLQ